MTVLDVYGPLYFAAARTLRERLPPPNSAEDAAAVLRIRGNSQIGATLIEEIGGYAHELAQHGGRLYSCGMTPDLADKLRRADRLALGDEIVLVPARGPRLLAPRRGAASRSLGTGPLRRWRFLILT